MRALVVLAPLFVLLCFGSFSWACTCIGFVPLEAAVARSGAIFLGEAVRASASEADPPGFRFIDYTFRVKQSWRGPDTAELVVRTASQSSACGYRFSVGSSYLVFAYDRRGDAEEGQLSTSICSRTKHISEAEHDIQILNALSDQAEEGIEDVLVERWLAALVSSDPEERKQAFRWSAQARLDPTRALQQLVDVFENKPEEDKAAVPGVCWRSLKGLPGATELVLQAIEHESAAVRASALVAVTRLGLEKETAREHVLRRLTDPDPSVRAMALGALHETGKPNPSLDGNLTSLLTDEHACVRMQALSFFHPAAVDEDYDLLETLRNDANTEVRRAAIYAAARLPLDEAVAALEIALKDLDEEVRSRAVFVMQEWQGAPDSIESVLLQALEDRSPAIRRKALNAIAYAGLSSERVLWATVGCLTDEDVLVREEATRTLGSMGTAGWPALGDLELRLRDPDEENRVKLWAMVAIRKIRP